MAKAKVGDNVKINYTGYYEDGTVFNSSFKDKPLEFVIGSDAVIAGFGNAVAGMEEGENKKVSVSPEDAYGEHKSDLEFVIHGENIPEEVEPKVGTILNMTVGEGRVSNVVITNIEGDRIIVDGNHPLAGKTLTYEITLLEIVKSA
ncbi:MAG: FKBP-type peptidyl-prolyl cis-trans isomerase [Candidatus Anammoxibacter sp.]